jgi:hypothetical protein
MTTTDGRCGVCGEPESAGIHNCHCGNEHHRFVPAPPQRYRCRNCDEILVPGVVHRFMPGTKCDTPPAPEAAVPDDPIQRVIVECWGATRRDPWYFAISKYGDKREAEGRRKALAEAQRKSSGAGSARDSR